MTRSTIVIAAVTAVLAALGPGGRVDLPEPQEEKKTTGPDAILRRDVGTWAARMKAFNALTGEEVVSSATEINKLGPGKATVITDFRGQFMGKPFIGHGMLGFDDENRLVYSWTDNRSGKLRFLKGEVSADGNKRVLHGTSRHMDEVYKERHTVTYDGKRKRRFTIETQGSDGKWIVALQIDYVKRR